MGDLSKCIFAESLADFVDAENADIDVDLDEVSADEESEEQQKTPAKSPGGYKNTAEGAPAVSSGYGVVDSAPPVSEPTAQGRFRVYLQKSAGGKVGLKTVQPGG